MKPIEVRMPSKVAGIFTLTAVKTDEHGNETRRHLAGPFHNLITDQGLDFMGGSSDHLARFCVGTGSTAPANGDTELEAQIAYVASSNVGETAGATSTPPYYAWIIKVARFPEGSATGNLSEIGIGTTTNPVAVFSRSLILDGDGDPTTVTVLADEALDVTYELRNYFDPDDVEFGISFSGETYDCTMRPIRVSQNIHGSRLGNGVATGLYTPSGRTYRSPAVLGLVTATDPTGTLDQNSSDRDWSAYGSGTHYRDLSVEWGLGGAATSGISVVMIDAAYGGWQIHFDPPIPKDATKVLNLVFRYGPWSRYAIP